MIGIVDWAAERARMVLAFIVLSIVQFAASGCSFAAAQISWTCIACVLFSVLSAFGTTIRGPSNACPPAATVTYAT